MDTERSDRSKIYGVVQRTLKGEALKKVLSSTERSNKHELNRTYHWLTSFSAVTPLWIIASALSVVFAAESDLKRSVSDIKNPIVSPGQNDKPLQALVKAHEDMHEDYGLRTEHFITDGRPKYINRLILERSPYLLQHAHNPVNWYPFESEAFDLAVEQNKPVFLSIGNATCHWCHVMERENFENEAIAELLNDHFIAIKVDREQLPDVDSLYMSAVLMINGHGGWPMSNFLDSTGRSFHSATYIPPYAFKKILNEIKIIWRDDKQVLLEAASDIFAELNRDNSLSSVARKVGDNELARAREKALAEYDDFQGGFSQAPKFPQEDLLTLLFDQARSNNHTPSFDAVYYTLERMAAGGIHDKIGGGFHRYAVDEDWLVPHFEKMLYNQALLSRVYTQAFSIGGNQNQATTAIGIYDYVAREMTSPAGLFYSATDADSGGAEGTFFLGQAAISVTALAVRPKDLYDSSIPSRNSVALRVLAKLYKRTGEERFADRANELISAFSAYLAEQPNGFYYMLTVVSEHLSGEAGPLDYAVRGVAMVFAERRNNNIVDIHVNLENGWQLNSNTPIQDYLVPTTISSSNADVISDVHFPSPVLRKLGFEPQELSLFEGSLLFSANVDSEKLEESTLPINIRVQACNDEVCLAPETVSVDLAWIDKHKCFMTNKIQHRCLSNSTRDLIRV